MTGGLKVLHVYLHVDVCVRVGVYVLAGQMGEGWKTEGN